MSWRRAPIHITVVAWIEARCPSARAAHLPRRRLRRVRPRNRRPASSACSAAQWSTSSASAAPSPTR
eukprot:8025916-Pyramimonas_sp.AAC.1